MSEGALNHLKISSKAGPMTGTVNSSGGACSLGDSFVGGWAFSGAIALTGALGEVCGMDGSHKMHKPFESDGGGSKVSSTTHMSSVQSSSLTVMTSH